MHLSSWASSDIGLVRMDNEDSYFVDDSIGLYLVADGMGGHAGGAYASAACADVVNRSIRHGLMKITKEGASSTKESIVRLLAMSVREASARIFNHALEDRGLQGMGTTLTGVLFHEGYAHIVHVGDSRLYMLRNGELQQITNDHTWVNEQINAGLLTAEEAEASELKHIITRSVGFEPIVEADVSSLPVCMGDAFILCSDGLSNHIADQELCDLAKRHYYQDLPGVYTQLALDRGGDDNITVITILASNDQPESSMTSREWQITVDHPPSEEP